MPTLLERLLRHPYVGIPYRRFRGCLVVGTGQGLHLGGNPSYSRVVRSSVTDLESAHRDNIAFERLLSRLTLGVRA